MEVVIVNGELCETSSKTWSGKCKDTDKCNKQCKDWEGAKNGACHQREAEFMCFCYTDCSSKGKTPSPSPAPSPPSDKPPTPPGDGQPPPPGGQPAPPPGCAKLDVHKLISEALTRYKIEVEKVVNFELPVDPSIILV
ncbi:hypothetical protein L1887_24978 [Cichorium endivia]|nr:hypothetical protein L1887_24978 [Cichorium endivia]